MGSDLQSTPVRFPPVFLSTVIVVHDQGALLHSMLQEVSLILHNLVCNYEIIIIDNASKDESVKNLKELTSTHGIPNLQVFALTKSIDYDIAAWVGIENALGDFVAIVDPYVDDVQFLSTMLDRAILGVDVVFATNQQKPPENFFYRVCYATFHALYKAISGVHLAKEAPAYRLISKRVISYILQHPTPGLRYRHLPATAGFSKVNLKYSNFPKNAPAKSLRETINRGIRILTTTTRVPLRIVTALTLFGALSNLLYSGYVIAIALWQERVAPGWITLSLQQSGMFFLFSLVLLVLSEYILQLAHLSNEGPLYHIAQEFTSAVMTHHQKLNIEDVSHVASQGDQNSNTLSHLNQNFS